MGCIELMVQLGGTRVGWIELTVCLAGTELREGCIELRVQLAGPDEQINSWHTRK